MSHEFCGNPSEEQGQSDADTTKKQEPILPQSGLLGAQNGFLSFLTCNEVGSHFFQFTVAFKQIGIFSD